MAQRAARAAAGEDAPATRARQRTARPAGSEAEHRGLPAQTAGYGEPGLPFEVRPPSAAVLHTPASAAAAGPRSL